MKVFSACAVIGGGVFYFYHLEEIPITNRKVFVVVPQFAEERLSNVIWHQLLNENHDDIVPENDVNYRAIKRVTERIIESSKIPQLKKFNWEIVLVDKPIANAYAIPAGKIIVFTGILPLFKDEEGMATVLSHEIGHVLARHSVETLSWHNTLFFFFDFFTSKISSLNTVAGLFLQLGVILPFSRSKENEADYIGIILMSRAGYDASNAYKVFERLKENFGDGIEFLSTHPCNSTRIEKLKRLVPIAKKEFVPYKK